MVESVKEHNFKTLHDTTYGSFISVSKLYRHAFDQYDSLFLKAPSPDSFHEIHIRPRGTYLLAYCKGSWDKLPGRYEELLEYAAEHRIRLHGYSYEIGINDMAVTSMDDYITQIEIPADNEAAG